MADKSTQLLLSALSKAALEPNGIHLHNGKNRTGMFPANAAARLAAQRCKDDGLVRLLRTETNGKSNQEICAITEKGLAYLLSESHPKQILEDFVRVLEARREQFGALADEVRSAHECLDALKATSEKVLQQIVAKSGPVPAVAETNGEASWRTELLHRLAHWRRAAASGDFPLSELFQQLQVTTPHLTIGVFHDELRRLHQEKKIWLHPWTGPLYELPAPAVALLIGHEIVYYVSLRSE